MKFSDLHFDLPDFQIAQYPNSQRDHSRMLFLDRSKNIIEDSHFYNVANYLRPGDVLVLNNSRVFHARLLGVREGFPGRMEVFLVQQLSNKVWEVLIKPGRRISVDTKLVFGDGALNANVLECTSEGRFIVRFEYVGDIFEILEKHGQVPLPPYIQRHLPEELKIDSDSYQTIYAKENGSIAAPTAGLHFTNDVLDILIKKGIEIVELTLHVGYGTFQPVRVEKFDEHTVEAEYYEISTEAATVINLAKKESRRVIGVGTTTTRALESAVIKKESGYMVHSGNGKTDLVIFEGFDFKILDGLITNFHLPCSSLLALVCTFGGYELVMKAYKQAVEDGYRFYSYGDCMLIL